MARVALKVLLDSLDLIGRPKQGGDPLDASMYSVQLTDGLGGGVSDFGRRSMCSVCPSMVLASITASSSSSSSSSSPPRSRPSTAAPFSPFLVISDRCCRSSKSSSSSSGGGGELLVDDFDLDVESNEFLKLSYSALLLC